MPWKSVQNEEFSKVKYKGNQESKVYEFSPMGPNPLRLYLISFFVIAILLILAITLLGVPLAFITLSLPFLLVGFISGPLEHILFSRSYELTGGSLLIRSILFGERRIPISDIRSVTSFGGWTHLGYRSIKFRPIRITHNDKKTNLWFNRSNLHEDETFLRELGAVIGKDKISIKQSGLFGMYDPWRLAYTALVVVSAIGFFLYLVLYIISQ